MKHAPVGPHRRLVLTAAGALLLSCSSAPPAPDQGLGVAVGAPLQSCAELAPRFHHAHTVLDSATVVAAGDMQLGGQPIGEHCLVRGRMHPRRGSDGRDYAIGFEMRLPGAWNGRFYHQGNGGLDGIVHTASGEHGGGPLTSAL
ncbi:MAG: tannase/feruloyl esterase family alpha/beta hydrolase, partial [Gammaproteobacteria bacterium]|nr:tannase/feruloyl esterase family alpha/beta hydrolase [Gammaproteobacteria bacterium]